MPRFEKFKWSLYSTLRLAKTVFQETCRSIMEECLFSIVRDPFMELYEGLVELISQITFYFRIPTFEYLDVILPPIPKLTNSTQLSQYK